MDLLRSALLGGASSRAAAHLGHVQPRLPDGQLEDGPGPLGIPQDGLQLGELDPGGAVLRVELQVLLVELPAAVKLSQLQLQFDVALQELVLGTLADGRPLSHTHTE